MTSKLFYEHSTSPLTPDPRPWPERLGATRWLPSSRAHSALFLHRMPRALSPPTMATSTTHSHTGGWRTSRREGLSFNAVLFLITVHWDPHLAHFTDWKLKPGCNLYLLIQVLRTAASTTLQWPPGRGLWGSTWKAPQRAGGGSREA